MTKPRWYKLIGKIAVLCDDMTEWARWRADNSPVVMQEYVGPLFVSTVFIGLDARHIGTGDPLLFETMVFSDGDDRYQVRTSTWGQAEKAHAEAVILARHGRLSGPTLDPIGRRRPL